MANYRRIKQNIVGICCEHSRLSITWMVDEQVKKSVYVDIPENIADGSTILSNHLFGELVKDTMRANRINCRNAAFSLPYDSTFLQMVTLPRMDDEQLRINIPFEFRDFINGELSDFYFAFTRIYSTQELEMEAAGEEASEIHVIATAVEKKLVHDIAETLEYAGLKLVYATSEVVGFRRIGCMSHIDDDENTERCFMDIGRDRTRMFIFKDKHFKLMHGVDIGERRIIQTIADEMGVDEHLAQTYYETNYEDCWNLPAVVNIYKDISLEILKAINFYEVSDFTARLSDVVLSGGGSIITPLVELLKGRINMNVMTIGEAFPEWDVNADGKIGITAPSLGIAIASYRAESIPMNLIEGTKKKKTKKRLALPSVAAVIVLILLFAKFAVYDRLHEITLKQQRVDELNEELMTMQGQLEDSKGISEQYYHYTWADMSEEELTAASRVEISNLIEKATASRYTVYGYTVSTGKVVVDVSASSLMQLSQLSREFESAEFVESCAVQTAQSGEEEVGTTGVRASMILYLTESTGEEDR